MKKLYQLYLVTLASLMFEPAGGFETLGARTAVGKRVKTLYIDVQKAIAWNSTTYNFYPAQTFVFEEDVRIIGANMTCHAGGDATALSATQNGEIHTHGEISRHGERGKPSSILDVNLQTAYTLVVSGAAQAGDTLFGEVMFPDGHGVDIDEGEALYVHAGCFASMFTAGNHQHSIFGCIYYVER